MQRSGIRSRPSVESSGRSWRVEAYPDRRDVPVTLHRCSLTGFKSRFHPCWRVESALRDQGIEYTRVTQMGVPKSRRTALIAGTGQKKFPAIEFEDGTWYRAESNDMAARIRAGHLFDTD